MNSTAHPRVTSSVRRITRRALLALASLWLVTYSEAQTSTDAPPPGAESVYLSKPMETTYDARLRMDYQFRAQDNQQESDLYNYFSGGVHNTAGGWLDVYMSGMTYQDLSRHPDSSSLATNMFAGLDDANGVRDFRLFQLYGDIHDPDGNVHLDVGRQYLDVADYILVDGGQLLLFENELMGGRMFYGKPVSFYTSQEDDTAYGLSLVGRPWDGNRTRLTYAHVSSSQGTNDANYFVDSQQIFSDTVRGRVQASMMNGDFRMMRSDCYYFAPDGKTDAALGVSRWGSYDAATLAYSPLYDVLGKQDPYSYAYARFSQEVFTHIILSPGISWRQADGSSVSYNNQDYRDYDLTLTYEPIKEFSASISGHYWDLDSSNFLGVDGELCYRYDRQVEFSLGTSYVQYSYVTYSDISYVSDGFGGLVASDGLSTGRESPNSYTYFLRARWKINRNLTFRVEGDVEDDSASSSLGYSARASIEASL